MMGLQALLIDAFWPRNCPARRHARRILCTVVAGWAIIITGAILLGLALASGRH